MSVSWGFTYSHFILISPLFCEFLLMGMSLEVVEGTEVTVVQWHTFRVPVSKNHKTNWKKFYPNRVGNLLLRLFIIFFSSPVGGSYLYCYFSASRFFSATSVFFWKEEDKWNYMIHWTTRDDSGVIGKYCIYSVLTVSYSTRNVILAHTVA